MANNMTTALEPDTFYHIFNRGNDGINIFYKEENYRYFLIKYDQLSYAKSINQQESRTGSLFQKYFRRQAVTDGSYFTRLVWYIHNNAVHHGIYGNLETYPWSTYRRMLADTPSKLMKEGVLTWFGGRDNYVAFHRENAADTSAIEPLLLE